jgi:hypothetical protein
MIGRESMLPKEFGDFVYIFLGALALGYIAYEIERRRQRLHDIWDVLDGEDAVITERLVDMVESGELQPYTGATLA